MISSCDLYIKITKIYHKNCKNVGMHRKDRISKGCYMHGEVLTMVPICRNVALHSPIYIFECRDNG